ncbi:MAG: hypothetical protein JO013_12640 [Alphaproteobacteria bacterium]|nr:hypothetical protein [Alphaproteobacteria bacterium]
MRNSVMVTAAAAALAAVAPAPAAGQLFFYNPEIRTGPVEPSDPIVGEPLPGATPAEQRANLLWNLRAAMNVAALQCQPAAPVHGAPAPNDYMRAAPNYNGFIAHHAGELAAAYQVLGKYFLRTNGPKGAALFDQYSTRTYNGFSTTSVYGFCQVATADLKSGLRVPKGQLVPFAVAHMRELRSSLAPAADRPLVYNPYLVQLAPLPNLAEQCWNGSDELLVQCGGTGTTTSDKRKKRRG